jgi:hypothetical protein
VIFLRDDRNDEARRPPRTRRSFPTDQRGPDRMRWRARQTHQQDKG